MTELETRRSRRARRPRVSIVGVLGELLITAGVLVLLFLGWQLWFNDLVEGSAQNDAAGKLAESWKQPSSAPSTAPSTTASTPAVDPAGVSAEPVVRDQPKANTAFATIRIPRIGADYQKTITEGTDGGVLAKSVGHYDGTAMPGAVGNFAVAGHRTTHGAPFHDLAELRAGDHIYVETADGWYVYDFRNMVYVPPTGVQVLDAVPEVGNDGATDRVMTMTTCNPMFSAAERMIAFSVFDRFVPRSAGAPTEIASAVAAQAAQQ